MAPAPLISATGLTCVRGRRLVFSDISFAVNAGEALIVTGPNGAGKTSLLRLLAGLGAPAAGSITCSARSSYLGHLSALKPTLTVAENLQYGSTLTGKTSLQLEAVGLAHVRDIPVRLLSQGQQRRVALARAFMPACKIWLLDEPTVGLDAVTVQCVSTLLQEHLADGGAIIAATHLDLGLPATSRLELEA
jgi:heme exporter protein A